MTATVMMFMSGRMTTMRWGTATMMAMTMSMSVSEMGPSVMRMQSLIGDTK